MLLKLFLPNAIVLSFFLFATSASFAMWAPGNSLYDTEQERIQAQLKAIKSQRQLGYQQDAQTQQTNLSASFQHDPERIYDEREKYTFLPIEWKTILTSEETEKIHVPMGQCRWIDAGSNTLLYTDKLCDCIGVVFQGPRIGLTHISLTDHSLLKEELGKIEHSENYKVFFVSHYFSKNLEEVKSIVEMKFSNIYADISNNYMEHDLDDTKEEWLKNHKFYFAVQSRFMQAEQMASRTVCISGKTGCISNALPQ